MPNKFKLLIIIGMLFSSVMTSFAQNTALISYDEVVTGELDDDTYEQLYTFEGEAGDTIVIQMDATSNDPRLDSFLTLRGIDGQDLTSDDDSAGNLNSLIGPYTLQESGIYTIVATRYQLETGTSTGSYELTVTLGDFETVSLDDVTEVTIDGDNSVWFFSFTPPASDLYQLNYNLLSGDYGSDISVRDPQGNYIANTSVDIYNTDNFAVMALNEGETVNIYIRSYASYDENGNFQEDGLEVSFSIVTTTSEPLVFDGDSVTVTGTLETSESVDYYTFNAEAGQTLGNIVQNENSDDSFEFYAIVPSGYTNFYGSSYYSDSDVLMPPQILTESGEYILVVHRGTLPPEAQTDGAVNYDFTMVLRATTELVDGVPVTGTISSEGVYENGFIYNGQAGETITFTLTSTNDEYRPAFSIELPPQDLTSIEYRGFNANFSSSEPSTISYDVTLPYDGAYIVRISNINYQAQDYSGDYELVIESN